MTPWMLALQNIATAQMPAPHRCLHCRAVIPTTPGFRPRRFCPESNCGAKYYAKIGDEKKKRMRQDG